MYGNKYKRLMEPGFIGSVRVKNRIIKTGSTIGFESWEDGYIQQKVIAIYEILAKGGAGLVTIGGAPLGVPPGKGFSFNDDKYLPSMKRLADAIHKHGCPVFLQVFHVGPRFEEEASRMTGTKTVAASHFSRNEIPLPSFAEPRELTVKEIEGIVDDFIKLGERIKKAGFDGIELNAACNHLLNSFLSRGWNKRRDAYGIQSLKSRAKIVVDIIKGIKKINGRDFAIIALINGAEPGLKNGITSKESQGIAKILQEAGADAIHIRAELYNKPIKREYKDSTQFPDKALYPETPFPLNGEVDDSLHGAGGWVPVAAAVKKVVSVPVICSGRLNIDLGEKLLKSGKVDFISFNRRLMADPDLPNKVAAGRIDDIRPCTGCITCFNNNEKGFPAICQVNAALGKPVEYEILPTKKKKKVMIIGSGPAGMETARVAAMRGHDVSLFEKSRWLGGSIVLAATVKGFHHEDFLGLVRFLKTQIKKLGVKVYLGKDVTKNVVEKIKPDVLIIAGGATHNIPDIPGINRKNVVTSKVLHTQLKGYVRFLPPKLLRPLTRIWMPIGKSVVIMGGNIQGCQTAEFLVRRGRKVTIVETGDKTGDGLVDSFVKPHLLDWLEKRGVIMYTGAEYEEITDKGIIISRKDGKRITIEADTILTALPLLPNSNLVNSLKGSAPEIHVIGDCNNPQLTVDAIADGSRIARMI